MPSLDADVWALRMKCGLIARAEDRGLGNMTWAFHEHVQPERTLLIDMGPTARGFVQHVERYPGATVVAYNDGQLDEQTVRSWLDGLDVLYSAETFYDPRVVSWSRDAHVATVLHVMPEFWRSELPHPDVVWAPTSWRLDTLPPLTRFVPVPMTAPRWLTADAEHERLRVLHVAGNRAAADRNGTVLMMNALRYVRSPIEFRAETQGARLPSQSVPPNVQASRHCGGRADRWALYEHADVLVLPRRYGGLCLPAIEAMACGVVAAMPNVPPNADWPVVLMDAGWRGTMQAPAGQLACAFVDPRTIAATIDTLASDRGELLRARAATREWAERHTWERLLTLYVDELSAAAQLARR